jgi:hypothetical protein
MDEATGRRRAMSEVQKIIQLLAIAEKAIEVDGFMRDVRFYSDALGSGYADFKEKHGLARIEPDMPEWSEMMLATKDDYNNREAAKRHLRNAQRRLETAIRRYRLEGIA